MKPGTQPNFRFTVEQSATNTYDGPSARAGFVFRARSREFIHFYSNYKKSGTTMDVWAKILGDEGCKVVGSETKREMQVLVLEHENMVLTATVSPSKVAWL